MDLYEAIYQLISMIQEDMKNNEDITGANQT